ncbi:hypothetical protein ACO0LG_28945 [Undibacterium sp. Ji42W]|uniref:hypothetical protein n=1 Tax=Undibacterium sp. Ji42W TaxID=3413039 RepID=UPI003BEFF3C9
MIETPTLDKLHGSASVRLTARNGSWDQEIRWGVSVLPEDEPGTIRGAFRVTKNSDDANPMRVVIEHGYPGETPSDKEWGHRQRFESSFGSVHVYHDV